MRGTLVFADARADTVERLGASARSVSSDAGDYVFRRGDSADALVVVRRGIVQIVRPAEVPVTLGIFGPRESIGLAAMLDRSSFPADAIAASRLETVRIPAVLVLAAMDDDAGFVRSVNRALLAHTRALQTKIDLLTAGEVSARLSLLLGHLAERFGDETEDGSTWVPVGLSRADLSRLVGARPETVIRVMSRWQKAGALETTDEGFRLVDRGALV